MRSCLCLLLAALLTLLVGPARAAAAAAAAADRPNIVLFLADDLTWSDCPPAGQSAPPTPNMDRLVKAGMTFTRAFVASPSCAPSRGALLTSLDPMRNGAMRNHTTPRPGVRRWPAYFQALGYETVAIGKVAHYATVTQYGFDFASHYNYHQDDCIAAAVQWLTDRKSTKPLCLIVGTNWPHVPWPAKGFGDPADVTLGTRLVDTPQTRAAVNRYHTAVSYADRDLGLVYDAARKLLGDNTLFAFSSDHGAQFPGGKWNLYDTGVRTPLYVVWPGKIKPGSTTSAMVSWIDLLPTLLQAVGGTPPPTGTQPGQINGRSFLPVLLGQTDHHRDRVFLTHSGDGKMNQYPQRGVRTRDFKYIRNLDPDAEYHSHVDKAPGKDRYFPSWLEKAKTDPAAAAIVHDYYKRPPEELYDLNADPDETHNLAADPAHAATLASLRAAVDAWMKTNGDEGMKTERTLLSASSARPAKGQVQNPPPIAATPRVARLSGGTASQPAAQAEPNNPRPPAVPPAMSRPQIESGLQSHDHALFIKQGWIRDPYITLGPDDLYYLTGTTPNPHDPREHSDPYNTGLHQSSIVGSAVRVWRSKDLIDWQELPPPFTLDRDSFHKDPGHLVWAPELHWLGDRWALVHCPADTANLALTQGPDLKGPWTHPLGDKLGPKHDPSLFKDGDTWWLTWSNTLIAPLNKDFTDFTAPPTRIDPSGSRTNSKGKTITAIGHEGATLLKIGRKYVHVGTAWSTDLPRKGSYNLYYCTADTITGPYGPRRFLGRFLGHGTPFQTRDGQWWCTAFFNANTPPLPRQDIQSRDLSSDAQTINPRGTTIVPLTVQTLPNGDVSLRAADPAYATPGPDEVQKF